MSLDDGDEDAPVLQRDGRHVLTITCAVRWQQERGVGGRGGEGVWRWWGDREEEKRRSRRRSRSWNSGNFNKCRGRLGGGVEQCDRGQRSTPNDGWYAATAAELPINGWHGTNTHVSDEEGRGGGKMERVWGGSTLALPWDGLQQKVVVPGEFILIIIFWLGAMQPDTVG